jgi:type VII secretion protein EccB
VHSRSDQVQAHTYMTGRLVSALVRGEPDLATPPLRRTRTGMFIGVVVAALVTAVFVVLGLFLPSGSTAWAEPGVIVVQKGTGTRYVYASGQLRPLLNLASARLLLGADAKVVLADDADLAGVERGSPVGIVGAPDTLPSGDARTPWSVCATTVTDSSGTSKAAVALGIGDAYAVTRVPEDRGYVVTSGRSENFLVWRDRRMKLGASWVGPALGYDMSATLAVRDAWLNAIPVGPELGPIPVANRGAAGLTLGGQKTRIGQVFVVAGVDGGADRYFLLTTEGLQPLTATGVALVLGDPATAEAYGGQPVRAVPITTSALAAVLILPAREESGEQPVSPPVQQSDGGRRVPCFHGTGQKGVLVTTPAASGAAVAGPGITRDENNADVVTVAPGAGLLARSAPAPDVNGMGLYLVSEPGVKFPLPDNDSAAALGYEPASRVGLLPPALLALLPTGPVLRKPA